MNVNAVAVVGLGSAAWLVAFFVLLAVREQVGAQWMWTALAGAVLGLIGLPVIFAQRRAAARRGVGNSDR